MDSAGILIATSIVLILLTVIGVSYKTGFVAYSIWSFTRDNQPKFEVDKSKIGKFIGFTTATFLLNIVYGLVVVRDPRELEGIVMFGIFNTVFVAYGLAYWVLLKERAK